jgi:hypothetical protein
MLARIFITPQMFVKSFGECNQNALQEKHGVNAPLLSPLSGISAEMVWL